MAALHKVVLVTGATSGAGLAISSLLSQSSYKVYGTARNLHKADQLHALAKERNNRLEILELDVTKEETISQAIKTIISKESKIDILVNNAGYAITKPAELTSMAEFREIFETNFFGLVALTKEVIPYMREARSGHIINISSFGGLVGQPFHDAYSASKFAVTGFTESLHSTLTPFGISVTLVCPGAITTPFLSKAVSTVVKEQTPYSELQQAYATTMHKIFAGNAQSGIKTSQTAEEIAVILKDIIETDKPHFLYPTSDYMKKQVALKLVDVTGDTLAEFTIKRSYGENFTLTSKN